MPRPRLIEDDAILDAAERAMAAFGATTFSLEHVATPLGVSPQALLHRFGSKHALILAVARRRGERATHAVRGNDAHVSPGADASPLGAMLDFFEQRMRSRHYARGALASGMTFMLAGVTDEAIRPHIMTQVTAIRANLLAFVSAAVDAKELHGDPATIARLIEATYNGALYLWLIERKGTAWSYFEPMFLALLAPYRSVSRAGHHVKKR